jgi:hypothetical protein
MPGTLRLNRYDSRLPQRWEQALTVSLDEVARNAVRPLRQSVPTNAEAVIFADRAEMLACLALDWAYGTLTSRWWWRRLLRDFDVNRMVWSTWLDTPNYAPAALAHLAARGEAVMVVRRMDETTATVLLRSMLLTFNLDALSRAIEAIMAGSMSPFTTSVPPTAAPISQAQAVKVDEAYDPSAAPPASSSPVDRIPSPWAARVPESLHQSLTMPRRLLLGVALSLTRDPVRTRTASFAWETQRWMQNESVGINPILSESTEHCSEMRDVTRLDDPANDDDEQPPIQSHETAQDETRSVNEPMYTERPSENTYEALPTADHVYDDPPANAIAIEPEVSISPEPSFETKTPVEIAFGGLFYLLNLAVHLGFYDDYTSPRHNQLELSIWDFVTLVGTELLGGTPADPIWALLEQLAGRDEDEPPGSRFSPPDRWRIDPRWLDAFPERRGFTWAVDTGLLCVQHPAGFPLVDIPLEGDLASQLDEIRDIYGIDEIYQTNLLALLADPLQRWLGWLMPYIRARLCRALGLNDGEDPAPLLCQHRARVFVTPAHVDVMLNLDRLPIEIRLARLDRNPGWLPGAGRTVTFHFESNGG